MRFYKLLSLILLLALIASSLVACGETATPAPLTTAPVVTTVVVSATPASVPATVAPASTTAPTTATPAPVLTASAQPATTVPPTTVAPTPTVNPTALRQTKWAEVLKNDPQLKVEPDSFVPGGFRLSVKGSQVAGGPLLDEIVYVDMDGDGVEEAAITLVSGGTAGAIGFLIYRYATLAPRLVVFQEGYKLGLKNEQGKLVVSEAIYGGWEPNCCPSGISQTTYTLKADKLNVAAQRSEGNNGTQALAVEQFYQLLNDRKFEAAYKLLSASYQKANPYSSWSAGYATSKKISVETTETSNDPSTVQIQLTAVDSTSGGGESTRRFTGSWKVSWDSNLKSWTLSDPSIKEAPSVRASVHPALQPLITTLKSKTQVPVFLPGFLGDLDKNIQVYASIEKIEANSYTIDLGGVPDCNGATVCRIGTVSGEKVGPNTPALKGTKVALDKGLSGYFSDFSCGASCGDASLSWQQGDNRYTVTLKAAKIDALTKMANSAINNGPL